MRDISFSFNPRKRVGLIGPKGCGKTTLLRILTGEDVPDSGQVTLTPSNLRPGYLPKGLELAVIEDDHPVSALSGGQKTHLSLALVLLSDPQLLLLDEPINHLDIPSRELFEQALSQFEGAVLTVVHDRYFIQRFANQVWVADTQERGIVRPT